MSLFLNKKISASSHLFPVGKYINKNYIKMDRNNK